MSAILTLDEIERITDRQRPSAQCRALDRMGIRYIRGTDGSPIVRPEWLDGESDEGEGRFLRVLERSRRFDLYRCRVWRYKPIADVLATSRPYVLGGGPNVGGVYFLLLGFDLRYIGQSTLISERLWQHRKQGREFNAFAYVACPLALLTAAETRYINEARPAENVLNYS